MDLIKQFAEQVKTIGNVEVQTVGNDKDGNLTKAIVDILSVIIGVLGFACVVVMIIGGYNYMTSTGDSAKIEKAKKTILYGLIGLVVCVLSFVIVNFVIVNILGLGDGGTESNNPTSYSQQIQIQ